MRVDACTTQVKECLQADDRCGQDYTQCVGLDTDDIIRMCPYDKLVGCQMVYGDQDVRGQDVYDQLANMVQGIMLNIDNNMLEYCQRAVDEAMIKVCGDTENCLGLTTDENIGARTLEYKICEFGATEEDYKNCRTDMAQISDAELKDDKRKFVMRMVGQVPWSSLGIDSDTGTTEEPNDNFGKIDLASLDKFIEKMSDEEKDQVRSEVKTLQANISSAIAAIEADPTVQYCMTGREVQGMRRNAGEDGRAGEQVNMEGGARFAGLTQQLRSIITLSALSIAQENYSKKYEEVSDDMMQAYVKMSERQDAVNAETKLEARRAAAKRSCLGLASASVLPLSRWGTETADSKTGMVASSSSNNFNYKETVTSTFSDETLVCHRCIRKQTCGKPKKKWCKRWNDPVETCNDIQF